MKASFSSRTPQRPFPTPDCSTRPDGAAAVPDSLLPQRFLFRFTVPCLYRDPVWEAEGGGLPAEHRLPALAELEGRPSWAELRVAWSEAGLALGLRVAGKKQPPWCRASRAEQSDGLHVWIDTRDVHNVHRATRFCHYFLFLPAGAGKKGDEPTALWLPIHRARDNPRPIRPGLLRARSAIRKDGYALDALIPAEALTGFDPVEHPRLGFAYAAVDRELGEQTLSAGSPMPYQEDPSLWATLELVR
jgi:hypothetical protein